MTSENLRVKVGDLQLRNPTLLAGGILGLTGASLKRVWESGAGAIITKSIGLESRKGYPGPSVAQTPCGLVNALGLPNPGIEYALEEIKVARESKATLLGSVFGRNVEEFEVLASKMEKAGVDAIEFNLSCPHAEDIPMIGQDPKLTKNVLKVRDNLETPIWVKLPGNTHLSNLVEVAKSAEEGGADALVISNTFPAMAINARAERPILGHKVGGLSGQAIRPIGLRLVYEVYKEVEIPIVGAGGVASGENMIEYVLAGASAVEVGMSIIESGLGIFQEICEEASSYLEGRKIKDLVGLAHQNLD
ncbi:hypothetical protein AKJ47_01590 [candidate division MSBL1 archaeon SCGC-AAA261G05]|uniref:Dihydroorotate dehydrogenase n=2 Tax=candidate division MSBL1 TaxID=215777 RepID=A0A133VBM3_9EURY|nr:hypothetical protein AKJ47_01590 [candidate division MSBL1 archaeon SCGC-AAA261G05]KXB04421.1 hypothetical protein AKJ48_02655 [candidate division MSBL1 archaeon SCGC-AAA261O19]